MAQFFAPCPRGLEPALAAELTSLSATGVVPSDGGVAFAGPMELACRANLESRIASRILHQLARAPYRDETDIYDLAHGLDWSKWFRSDRTLRVDVAASRSPLKSLEFATLRIKDGVCDRLRLESGARPSIDKERPDVRVHAFLSADQATIYLDTSGEPLFKRGYRADAGEAPLRENLAAGLLHLSGWTPGTPLLDPMCGSGTIIAEAALMALGLPPGLRRSFGFEKLLWHDPAAWQRIKEAAERRPRRPLRNLFARDLDAAAVARCQATLDSAGVTRGVVVEQGDVLAAPAPAPAGVIVTNPPYGVRLEDEAALAAFYPRLGDTLKKRYAGWNAWLFSADARLPKLIGLKCSRRTPLFNGAIECRLLEYRMFTGPLS
jgi:putative N6-adenine-specific DNA methylase